MVDLVPNHGLLVQRPCIRFLFQGAPEASVWASLTWPSTQCPHLSFPAILYHSDQQRERKGEIEEVEKKLGMKTVPNL